MLYNIKNYCDAVNSPIIQNSDFDCFTIDEFEFVIENEKDE